MARKPLKLLIVGYYFMRTESSGGHRLHAMVKYLSRKGWDVTVLTVRGDSPDGTTANEEEVFKYIPDGTRIIRTRSFEFDRISKYLRKTKIGGGSPSQEGNRVGKESPRRRWNSIHSLWKTPARWLRGVANFPDGQVGWYFPLLWGGWKLLKTHEFDVVLTSGPPHSCHLPFVVLKKCSRFYWVSDFRDPWTDPPFYALDNRSLSPKPVRLFLNRLLERSVLRNCDRILANTVGNEEALRKTFGDLVESKLTLLTNGFDEETAVSPSVAGAVESDFVFTGALYTWMLDVYLEALRFLRESGQRLPTLHIYGVPDDNLTQKVRGYGFENIVVFKGSVPYEQSLAMLGRARALLLLFIGHAEVFRRSVPSKLYAYLFSERPYLALVPDGDTARLLEEVGGGVVVKSSDPKEVGAAIASFLRSMDAGTITIERNKNTLANYSWSWLSCKLDGALRKDIQRCQE